MCKLDLDFLKPYDLVSVITPKDSLNIFSVIYNIWLATLFWRLWEENSTCLLFKFMRMFQWLGLSTFFENYPPQCPNQYFHKSMPVSFWTP